MTTTVDTPVLSIVMPVRNEGINLKESLRLILEMELNIYVFL